MSDSDRPNGNSFVNWLVPAMYVVGAMFFAGVFFSNIAGHKSGAYQKQYESQCEEAKSRYWVIIDSSYKALTANEDTDAGKREKKAREQVTYWCDLSAQQASADAASYTASQSLWVTVLTALGVSLVGGTLVYTAKAVNEAEKTTKAALFDQRARITVRPKEEGTGMPTIDGDGNARIERKIEIKNVGKNFASKVNISMTTEVISNSPTPFFAFEKCFRKAISEIDHDGQITLFSGEDYTSTPPIIFPLGELVQSALPACFVIFVVSYNDSESAERLHTAVSFHAKVIFEIDAPVELRQIVGVELVPMINYREVK